MNGSFLTQVMLPLALALIMFGMGLSLTKSDFVRLWKVPKPILVGLFGQLILLPILAYGIAVGFSLTEHLAIGLMILAACPGGTMSNIISHLGKANLALSVSLTAVTTLVCVFSTPLIIGYAIDQFGNNEAQSFSLASTTIGLIFITLLPVVTGIAIRHRYEDFALGAETFFRRFSTLFLVLMIVAIIIQERGTLVSSFVAVFGASITLNLVAVAIGASLGLLFKLAAKDSMTLGIEVGIQNASMAILISVSFLERPEYAIASGVYGLTMYIGAFILIYATKKISQPD